jgi:hypothetical protein
MLASTVNGRWQPGIGDPTFFGWATVAGYLLACMLCWLAFRRSARGITHPRESLPWFWAALSLVLLVLAVNKQLDLQTWFTQTGRAWAKQAGWYHSRQRVQVAFVWAIAAAGALGLAALAWLARRARRGVLVALAGLLFLVCFIVVRASSFHHVDHMLGRKLGLARLNVVLELGGIAVVAAGAVLMLRLHRRRARALEALSQPGKPAAPSRTRR